MSDRWQEGRQEASGVVGFFISIKFLTCQIWKVYVPAVTYVDYDDANINVLFVDP